MLGREGLCIGGKIGEHESTKIENRIRNENENENWKCNRNEVENWKCNGEWKWELEMNGLGQIGDGSTAGLCMKGSQLVQGADGLDRHWESLRGEISS